MARTSAPADRDPKANGRNDKRPNAARRLWIAGPRGPVMRLSLRFEARSLRQPVEARPGKAIPEREQGLVHQRLAIVAIGHHHRRLACIRKDDQAAPIAEIAAALEEEQPSLRVPERHPETMAEPVHRGDELIMLLDRARVMRKRRRFGWAKRVIDGDAGRGM